MTKTIAIIGNPNCGKTTLFNRLTGQNEKTANRVGVTVDVKYGKCLNNKDIKIVDLPGLYSFESNRPDEKTVSDFLRENKIDGIINVIDGNQLERSLILTNELISYGIPVLIAINFYDELKKKGTTINVDKVKEIFNVDCVLISAAKNENVSNIVKRVLNSNKPKKNGIEDKLNFLKKGINDIVIYSKNKKTDLSQKIDNVLLNKFFGVVFFVLIIYVSYFVSIKVGGILGKVLEGLIEGFSGSIYSNDKIPLIIRDFVSNAIINGVGSVLSFLPQILILFFVLTFIEDVGYTARISFLFDAPLKKIGLCGKSLVSVMLSSSCAVSGIMSAKSIECDCYRKRTVLLCPIMPCSAKAIVIMWFTKVFFNGNVLVATLLYFLCFITILIYSKISSIKEKCEDEDVFEIPKYRLPKLKTLFIEGYIKIKDFILKACSTIFLVNLAVWFLMSFGIKGYIGVEIENSFLYVLANVLKYVFYPLGFYNWQQSVAIICSFFAKESVVGIMSLISDYSFIFVNKIYAFSFVSFIILSPPCLVALMTMKNQLKDKKTFFCGVVVQFLIAYVLSLTINVLLKIIYYKKLIFALILFIIVFGLAIVSIIRRKNGKRYKNTV